MLSSLIPRLYIQVSPERLMVRNVKTGETSSEVPAIAIQSQPKPAVLGIGAQAQLHASKPGVDVLNPFGHPRSLVSDFTVGEQLMKLSVHRVLATGWFSPAPSVVLHLMGEPDGGYTQVEVRAMQEMARGAGASVVVVWQGRQLTDQEILANDFSSGGKVLS